MGQNSMARSGSLFFSRASKALDFFRILGSFHFQMKDWSLFYVELNVVNLLVLDDTVALTGAF